MEPAAALCAICQSPLGEDEELVACPQCDAPYHAECWQENGGCAIYGCSQVPAIEQRSALSIPASFWGKENKTCPKCNASILAAAVRCRHCGATFASAQPEDAGTFQQRATVSAAQPALRKTALWLFIFSLLPFCAPFAAVYILCWYPSHRREIAALPAMHGSLCRLALFISIGQTLLFIVMAVLFATFRSP